MNRKIIVRFSHLGESGLVISSPYSLGIPASEAVCFVFTDAGASLACLLPPFPTAPTFLKPAGSCDVIGASLKKNEFLLN